MMEIKTVIISALRRFEIGPVYEEIFGHKRKETGA